MSSALMREPRAGFAGTYLLSEMMRENTDIGMQTSGM
jgi:hypothetical protein